MATVEQHWARFSVQVRCCVRIKIRGEWNVCREGMGGEYDVFC
jgi:hypothetical protein